MQLKSVVKNNCQDKYGVCYFVPNETTQEHLDFNSVLSNKTFGSFRKLAVNEEAVFRMNEKEEVEIVYKDTEK